MKRIYIAGPIAGREDYLEKFKEAERELKGIFREVELVNPAYMSKSLECFSHREQVQFCFTLLNECSDIYLLEGWEDSRGAQAEYGYATAKGIRVLEQSKFRVDFRPLIKVETKPDEPELKKPEETKDSKPKKVTIHTKVCAVCGKEFTVSGRAAARAAVCAEACRREKARLRNKKWREKEETPQKPKSKILEKEGIRPSGAFVKEAKARKEGKRYADIQKENTLRMIAQQKEGANV